jgi:hypothetical protein
VGKSLGDGSGVGSEVVAKNLSGVTSGKDILFGSDFASGLFIVNILLSSQNHKTTLSVVFSYFIIEGTTK